MSKTREIVTKAVVGKGKRTFTTTKTIMPKERPDTILGCWVINHNYEGTRHQNKINIDGSYDINIWYSSDNDTKTEVIKDTNNYHEEVNAPIVSEDVANEEVVVRSLKQPTCVRCDIVDGKIEYTIEKELGVEIVGDIKVKIAYDEQEDPWQVIEESKDEIVEKEIDAQVEENYLDNKN